MDSKGLDKHIHGHFKMNSEKYEQLCLLFQTVCKILPIKYEIKIGYMLTLQSNSYQTFLHLHCKFPNESHDEEFVSTISTAAVLGHGERQ